MTPYLQDADVTLWHGDVLDVLREFEDGSVDCVVTSPPYWGLRDYGTGAWEGGDEGCDHKMPFSQAQLDSSGLNLANDRSKAQSTVGDSHAKTYRDVCGKCGARRVDAQLGLEPTPDEYVARMVSVFREVRRVLAPHGTCWVNLGDSYANLNHAPGSTQDNSRVGGNSRERWGDIQLNTGKIPAGLKPKDLVGIPWRVAFALQADGWWLRSDIVWAKPNPMPESVTDRPTKAHEYVFLLTKAPRYFFDQEAVREPITSESSIARARSTPVQIHPPQYRQDKGETRGYRLRPLEGEGGHRNIRSVWTIATQPYPEAHFATYPEELVRRCVLAGCPERVCRVCGKASERLTDVSYDPTNRTPAPNKGHLGAFGERAANMTRDGFVPNREKHTATLGWSDCGHQDWRPGLVLDTFVGSGTTCKVARDHGRHSVGIDLSADYLELAARRLQQQSLFSEASA